ncbi:MAG TPA: sigma-70 family RNA polymerase sigma factor [Planktothrix sp.]|jgi:RNA polymerase sigma-70 factor (ECF subfamily)
MALSKNETDSRFEDSAIGYADILFRIAYARLGNAHDAEDAVQETYLKAFRSISNFRAGTNMKAWLTQILINTIRDAYRRSNHRAEAVDLDEALGDGADVPTFPGPEEILCDDEIDPDLSIALKTMSETLAIPLILREAYEATYEEIANILDIPKGTVMSRLSRARTRLRELLLHLRAVRDSRGADDAVQ